MKKIWKALMNNPYFNALKNIRALLDYDQKKRGAIMFLLLLVNAGFDVLGLTTIFPLIDAALNPENIQSKWYLSYPYQWIGVEDNITFLFVLSIIIFIVFLFKNILSLLIYYIQSKYAFNVSLRLSKKIFQNYFEKGFTYINKEDSGTKVHNVINIPYIFASSFILQTFTFSTELVVLLIIFIGILAIEPGAIIVLIVVILPVFALVYQFTKRKVKKIGDKRNELYPKAYSRVWESMSAYVDIKLSNKEQYFFNKYSDLTHRINSLDALHQGLFGKLPQRLNDVVLGLGLMMIFFFALIFRERSSQIISILSVFGLAAYRFLPSVNRMMGAIMVIKNANYLIDMLKDVRNKKLYEFIEVDPILLNEHLKFENISFKYPGSNKNILNNFSLTIKKGETVGFIGDSGSGKTTLLNLILRLLKEDSGFVYLDGIPINEENKASFQKAIGYVQQDVFIKNGSLEENIAFGEFEEEIDFEKMNKAISDSMLMGFVKSHPHGTKMQLGENGVNLSGGQKQRIGIARALYKDSQILVFDEATSALDSETEKAIVKTIKNLSTIDKIKIIVAHRISTLESCDSIYHLSDGRIVKKFQYKDLLSHKI